MEIKNLKDIMDIFPDGIFQEGINGEVVLSTGYRIINENDDVEPIEEV